MKQSKLLFLCLLIGVSCNANELDVLSKVTTKENFCKTNIQIDENYNGFGMKVLQDGCKIIGEFTNGKMNGYGVCHYLNGDKYIGQFRNSNKDGEGVFISGAEVINGIWTDDEFIGTNVNSLIGCRTGDCMNGKGVQMYSDFTLYVGDFNNHKAEGEGICYYSDGDIYVGFWKNHYFDGQGVFYHKAGMKDSGFWESGKLLNSYEIADFSEMISKNPSSEPSKEVEEYTIESFAYAPTSKSVDATPKVYTGKIWAVVVGAAKYTDGNIKSLNFPDDDAYRFYSFLKSPEGGAIKDEQIKILIDETATRANILKSLTDFANQAEANDVFMFYFSGHGLPGAFLPIDAQGLTNHVKYKEIIEILRNSKAKSKIVIADACHSGGLIDFKGGSFKSEMDNYYRAIEKSQGGLVLLMSSKTEESSIENNVLRQGVFSYYLMKGLKGAANTNGDDIIRIDELFDYVQANVNFYTHDYQTPTLYGEGGIDHPIGFIRKD